MSSTYTMPSPNTIMEMIQASVVSSVPHEKKKNTTEERLYYCDVY